LIDRFLDSAWMERGLSRNTLSAYRTDLVALGRWVAEQGRPIAAAERGDILAFVAARIQNGARPRSTARQLSSFRRFFRWLARERGDGEDPTARISMPKIGRPLPQSLSEAQVEALLDAPDTTGALGHRDRT
ncbi:site-specific integrase, partial [Arthrospira platensis SPKY2]